MTLTKGSRCCVLDASGTFGEIYRSASIAEPVNAVGEVVVRYEDTAELEKVQYSFLEAFCCCSKGCYRNAPLRA